MGGQDAARQAFGGSFRIAVGPGVCAAGFGTAQDHPDWRREQRVSCGRGRNDAQRERRKSRKAGRFRLSRSGRIDTGNTLSEAWSCFCGRVGRNGRNGSGGRKGSRGTGRVSSKGNRGTDGISSKGDRGTDGISSKGGRGTDGVSSKGDRGTGGVRNGAGRKIRCAGA